MPISSTAAAATSTASPTLLAEVPSLRQTYLGPLTSTKWDLLKGNCAYSAEAISQVNLEKAALKTPYTDDEKYLIYLVADNSSARNNGSGFNWKSFRSAYVHKSKRATLCNSAGFKFYEREYSKWKATAEKLLKQRAAPQSSAI